MFPSCRHLGWRLRGEAAHIDSIEASLSGWQSTLPNSSDTQRISRFAQGMPLSLPLTGFAQFLTELLGAAKEPDDVNRMRSPSGPIKITLSHQTKTTVAVLP